MRASAEKTSEAAPRRPHWLARLLFSLRSGKKSKFLYYLRNGLSLLVPPTLFRARRERLLASIARRADAAEIETRAAYYCKPGPGEAPLPSPSPSEQAGRHSAEVPHAPPRTLRVRDHRLPRGKSAYFFDSREWLRYFPADFRFGYWPGDKMSVAAIPALVKSRPIAEDNGRSVLLNMDKLRHFLFVHDDLPFAEKDDIAVFRGIVSGKAKRIALFERHFGAPGLDMVDTSAPPVRPEWGGEKATIREQLRHKFILCVEGNDVATNLKWVFSSNSIAVMPRPEFETWFLEGLLEPDVHYIGVEPDFSDLLEKLDWYRARPEACARIAAAEHTWVARFQDPLREKLVSLRTLDRYFRATGQ